MMLVFTTRRKVRSAHLALFPICFTAQLDFAVSDIFVRENAYGIVGTARWADLSTRHQRSARFAFPTMPHASQQTSLYIFQMTL